MKVFSLAVLSLAVGTSAKLAPLRSTSLDVRVAPRAKQAALQLRGERDLNRALLGTFSVSPALGARHQLTALLFRGRDLSFTRRRLKVGRGRGTARRCCR